MQHCRVSHLQCCILNLQTKMQSPNGKGLSHPVVRLTIKSQVEIERNVVN